jgi:hypothetical protein
VHPPPSPARANYTLMMECTPESDCCFSVCSVVGTLACGRGNGGVPIPTMRHTVQCIKMYILYMYFVVGWLLQKLKKGEETNVERRKREKKTGRNNET